MTDHTARAVDLLTVESSSATIRVHAGIGYAILALTDALAGRVQRPRWDDDLRNDAATGSGPGLEVAPDAPSPVPAVQAENSIRLILDGYGVYEAHGDSYGIVGLDNLVRDLMNVLSPDDLRRVIGERDRLREGIRAAVTRLAPDDPTEPSRLYLELRALLADDPTHRGPITVDGKTSQERGGQVSSACALGYCDECDGGQVWVAGPPEAAPCAHACHRAPKEGHG